MIDLKKKKTQFFPISFFYNHMLSYENNNQSI